MTAPVHMQGAYSFRDYRFTGKERDSESGLDMFGARYYGSSIGRFMTPDWSAKPVTVPYAHFGNPQSLNLYSYVQNNPTTTGDPDGHCPQCVEEVLEYLADSPAGEAVENWGAQAIAGAGALLGSAISAAGNGEFGSAHPSYYVPVNEPSPLLQNSNAQAQQGSQPAQPQANQSSQSTPAQPEQPSGGNDLNRSSSSKQTGAQGQNQKQPSRIPPAQPRTKLHRARQEGSQQSLFARMQTATRFT